jgi:hypothetical protein
MKRKFIAVLLLISICLFNPGCRKKDGKVQVSGTVTWNDKPVKSGFIMFKPLDSQLAPEAGPIKDGQFSFSARPGKNTIDIRASEERGFNAGMNQPNIVQYLPKEFNIESTMTKEVSETEKNEYEFKLTGKGF